MASHAHDTTPPRGAVGGVRSPLHGPIDLAVTASDDRGLATASALVDGVAAAAIALSPSGCEPRGDAAPAPTDAQPVPCTTTVRAASLRLDLAGFGAGPHRLRVLVGDVAGNVTAVFDGVVVVAGPRPAHSPIVQVRFGRSGSPTPAPPVLPPVVPPRPPRCAAPWLSMMLAERPLRVRRGRPVLIAGRRHRFRGRLTCRVGRTRKAAPRGLRIELLATARGRVVGRTTIRTKQGGRVAVLISLRSSRTLVFRYREGRASSRVRIPVTVLRRGGGMR